LHAYYVSAFEATAANTERFSRAVRMTGKIPSPDAGGAVVETKLGMASRELVGIIDAMQADSRFKESRDRWRDLRIKVTRTAP
jgi:hypothetical protein